jgi:hypothetical protein
VAGIPLCGSACYARRMTDFRIAPPVGTYLYVLRRYDFDATSPDAQPIACVGYDEVVDSRAVELDGVVAHTAFLSTDNLRDRLTKFGWVDETQAWHAANAVSTPGVIQAVMDLGGTANLDALAARIGVEAAHPRLSAVLEELVVAGTLKRRAAGAVVVWSLAIRRTAPSADDATVG